MELNELSHNVSGKCLVVITYKYSIKHFGIALVGKCDTDWLKIPGTCQKLINHDEVDPRTQDRSIPRLYRAVSINRTVGAWGSS